MAKRNRLSEMRHVIAVIAADGVTPVLSGVWSSRKGLTGRGLAQAQVESSLTTHMFCMRFNPSVLSSHYVLCEGVLYAIDWLRDPESDADVSDPYTFLEIYCHKINEGLPPAPQGNIELESGSGGLETEAGTGQIETE